MSIQDSNFSNKIKQSWKEFNIKGWAGYDFTKVKLHQGQVEEIELTKLSLYRSEKKDLLDSLYNVDAKEGNCCTDYEERKTREEAKKNS